MDPALTPRLALAYLRELSADFRGGAVLGPADEPLAGATAVVAAAGRVLAAAGPETAVPVSGHVVHVARSDSHAIVAVYGALALGGLVEHDLRTALADLAGEPARTSVGEPATASAGAPAAASAGAPARERPEAPSAELRAAAEALFLAVQSGSEAPAGGTER